MNKSTSFTPKKEAEICQLHWIKILQKGNFLMLMDFENLYNKLIYYENKNFIDVADVFRWYGLRAGK
jgi:hypothetical protein